MEQQSDQDFQAALNLCASEAVQTPGAIQGHGAMLAVHNDSLEICYASDNTEAFLRVAANKLLGKPLAQVFGSKARHDLINGMMLREASGNASDLGVIEFAGVPLLVTASAAPAHTIFEFEYIPEGANTSKNALGNLEFLMAQASTSKSPQELFDISVELLRMLTEYDRVKVVSFDDEGHGTIVAEALSAGAGSFLGLRFPSWDIPAQARNLMEKISLRYIADSSARPVPVHAAPQQTGALDMTYAHLRAVSPIHLEYLRNMGVAASLTLNIMVDDRCWGMICFHHETPRYPSQRIRQMCRSYCEFFSLKLSNFLKTGDLDRLKKPDVLRRKLSDKSENTNLDQIFEAELLNDLADAMEADGAALIFNKTVSTHGLVPEPEALEEFSNQCDLKEGVTSTSNIKHDFPHLAGVLGSEIAGLLVARLPENSTFLFFRKGRDRVVKWAGAPAKNISKQTGRARLHPRSSFSEYLELVEGTSEPWTPEQLRIAEELWTMLLTSERADLIRKTNRQQSLLIDELNHRVRNILALIRSLSHQSRNENSSVETYVNALEARISALAAAHDLGAEKTELSATLKQIIEQEAAPYNQDKERVRIGGGNTGIRSDLAPIFALVVHELMTNAAKYGALSEDAGTIQVEIIKTGDGVTLHWQERGGPTVIEPEARGFGTRLIAASVPNELGGAVEFKYPPSGLVVNVSLPADIMVEKLALESPSRSETCACNPALSNQELAITSETCLVLEDNYVVSLDTVRILKSLGFDSVDTAFTASDALDKIARQPPSLAILDINLSRGLTSEPVAKELTARGVPFIFVTGYGDTQKLSQAFRSSPVLKKPVREDELRRKLHELFQ